MNRLDFNTWSGGDYLNNTSTITYTGGQISLSNLSSNGNHSFYIEHVGTGNGYITLPLSLTESDVGKQITLVLDVYTPNNSIRLQLYDSNYINADVPVNNTFERITVSRVIVSTDLRCLLNILKGTDGYFDNINIFIQ